jgi:hypothetical protein
VSDGIFDLRHPTDFPNFAKGFNFPFSPISTLKEAQKEYGGQINAHRKVEPGAFS